ncbi:MAG: hypothetical protein HN736_11325 [Anaerolineae bacterium]|jgi:hypothetical protein|nr:hypothetical protein [Anaerolineae bacterium]MBT7484134.1 hypothetical protein [Candidatus Peregrinibacteria bacterium]MBT4842286.1 hypothetical protein [Anaerolineae bacterium]MBT6062835.1 hypothetical protein [Anaerolineae bacterium]MBT6812308.1 hypothetical protein [Anaerolineae bacterium]
MRKHIEAFLLSPAYPLLLSVSPILTLYANNIYQVSFSVLLRPVLFSLLIGVLLFLAMQFFFQEWHKSAFFATIVIFFLGTYGHIKNFLDAKKIQGAPIYILGGGLLTIFFFIFLNKKYRNKLNYASLAPGINLMAIIFLLFPLLKTIQYNVARNIAFAPQANTFEQLDISNLETLPDIYYIIPDSYGSSDTLKEIYSYDNNQFITELEKLDFFVAKCSQSNYPTTVLSLASSLNMDYISNLSEHFKPDERDILYLFAAMRKNAVMDILSTAGYKRVAFATGFPWGEMKNADVFLSPPSGAVNEFEIMYLQTTAGQLLDDLELVDLDNLNAERYRERTRLVFDSLPEIATISEPKFVFIHLMLPHPPFGFDEKGNNINPAQVNTPEGYSNQAAYFGKEIIKNIEIILKQSKTPPIIIIQGDHGPWTARPDWRLSILNAYYFPEHTDVLYPKITPVNTFRLVLNEYLGANYDLLPDNSYNVKVPYIYDFTLVENTCKE